MSKNEKLFLLRMSVFAAILLWLLQMSLALHVKESVQQIRQGWIYQHWIKTVLCR